MRITFRVKTATLPSLYLQPIFVLAFQVVPTVDGAGGSVVVPVLSEFLLGGGRPLWPQTMLLSRKSCSEAKSIHSKKGKAMRGAGKNENNKLRSNCGAATSGAEERALSALLTCHLSLPTLVGIKGRRYIIQLYLSCFA